MLSFLQSVDKNAGRVGVHIDDRGAAVAETRLHAPGRRPSLLFCRYAPGRGAALAGLVKQLPGRKLPAVSVLQADGYHLHLVETPDVPEDELRAAIRWRIKDLIDFHIDDAVIDVFQMPAQGRGGPNQMMYAIAAKSDLIRKRVREIETVGLKLEVIDIPELCLRNVAALLEEDNRGVALLYMADSSSVLLLVRHGVLYLARRIDTGVHTLTRADGMRSSIVDGLALEVRRSLDYFESHYEQNAIPVLYTAGPDPSDQDRLAGELGLSVRHVDVAGIVDTEQDVDEETQRLCLPAIGAALRRDRVTL
jgi:MSHA biogenesis protein MshI